VREILSDLYFVLVEKGWSAVHIWIAVAWLVAAFAISKIIKSAKGGVDDLRDYYARTIQELSQRVNILRSERDDAEQRYEQAQARIDSLRGRIDELKSKYGE